MAEEVKKEEPKKVGPLGKLKELTEDKESRWKSSPLLCAWVS